MRRFVSVVLAAGLLGSLTACATAPTLNGCTPTFVAGGSSTLVTASGEFGAAPEAEFPTPLVAKKVQASVVTAGDGKVVEPGDATQVQVTIYDATTGTALISSDYTGRGLLISAIDGQPQFGGVAQCATVGSRVAAVGPAGELLGTNAITQNNLNVTESDDVVMVVDVVDAFLGRANGGDELAQAGFPSVVLAPDGQPGLTIPGGDIPTDLMIARLKGGTGQTVQKGDTVVLNYTGVLWDTKKVFDSTWDRGAPAALLAEDLNDDDGGVVPGFAKALIGQKVGSQVIVVIPPKFGYPAGSAPTTVPEGSTMIFVFDVLGIAD